MSIQFINIHSHQCENSGTICVRNVIAGKEHLPDSEKELYSYGLHPWFIDNREEVETLLTEMKKIVSSNQCVMIGECGLDKISETPLDWQAQVFSRQIHISEQLGMPMVIHCVKAFEEVLQIRKEQNAKQTWIFHGYGSSPELAKRIINQGCYLSFGKLILQTRSKALATLKVTDLSDFFLETDEADDVSIEQIYNHVSSIKSLEKELLMEKMMENFQKLFPKG